MIVSTMVSPQIQNEMIDNNGNHFIWYRQIIKQLMISQQNSQKAINNCIMQQAIAAYINEKFGL